MEEKIKLEFTKVEYDYLSDFLNSTYNTFIHLPKKMRSNKFDILYNLVHNQFLLTNENIKLNLGQVLVQSSAILGGGDFAKQNTTTCT